MYFLFLVSIGLKSVPTTVAVLRDPRYAYRARSIAARSLAKLAFPQLEALSPGLLRTELQRAYQFLSYHRVLESERMGCAGAVGCAAPGLAEARDVVPARYVTLDLHIGQPTRVIRPDLVTEVTM